jgi:hypothetical protein
MNDLYPPTGPAPSADTLTTHATAVQTQLTAAATVVGDNIANAVSGVAATAAPAISNLEAQLAKLDSASETLRSIARQARRISLGQPAHGAI